MEIRNYILSFIIGALSEVLVFSRGEWERHSPKVVLAFVLLFLGNISLLAFGFGFTLLTSLLETYALGLALVTGIFSCMVAYRLFFHPLKSFPGPLAARISAFWIFRQNVPDLKFYVKLRKVHEQYGDFVRIRPREISICHPDAVVDVHGPRNKIRKGEFYEHIYPFQSLQLSRDAAYHKNQRRHWDKAFQTKALQEYSPCLSKHYKILMNKISRETANETPIDISNNLMDLFFDIVSELTFGKSFDALTTGKRNPIIGEFLKEKKPVGFILITLWIFHLMRQLPIVKKNIKYWMDWYSDALAKRKDMDLKGTDFYTYLSKSEDFDFNGVQEAQLAIIAGADTVAITLSNACYFLCQYPEYQAKLYEEIRDLPTNPNGLIDDQLLVGKEYLLGIINESLRLHPPAPSGLQRLTPPEGATIAGRYIPGDTIVTTPTYSVHRDTRAFVKPDQFIPERWSSQPELVPRKDAFIPFSYGAYSCAGKPLAMIQMRMVLAMLVRKYELRFAPGKEAECRQYIEDQADCFTLNTHELPLVFKERVGKK